MRKKQTFSDYEIERLTTARDFIAKHGGPHKLGVALSKMLGAKVETWRVAKWRYIGVPSKWGIIMEALDPSVLRSDFNPALYSDYKQVINNKDVRRFLGLTRG